MTADIIQTPKGEIISQSEAARRKGYKKPERIRQHIRAGRLQVAKTEGRNVWVYASEVDALTKGHQGRPLMSLEEKVRRSEQLGFPLGSVVRWKSERGRNRVDVLAIVIRNGDKRIKVRIKDTSDNFNWAKPDELTLSEDQSGREEIELPSR